MRAGLFIWANLLGPTTVESIENGSVTFAGIEEPFEGATFESVQPTIDQIVHEMTHDIFCWLARRLSRRFILVRWCLR